MGDSVMKALRSPWPYVIALLGLAWAHYDLRMQVVALRAQNEALSGSTGSTAAQPPADEPPPEAPAPFSPPPEAPRPAPPPAPPWTCEGQLPEVVVHGVIGSHGQSVFECHARHGRPDERVSIELFLRVLEDGTVDTVHLANAERSPLTECVAQAAQSWPFPRPTGGCATVHAPFVLGAPAAPEPRPR